MPSWTSPRASASTLPISRVIARERRSLCSRHQLAEAVQDLAALRRRRGLPARQRHLGGADRHRGVGLRARLEPPDDVARIGRIQALERLPDVESTHSPAMNSRKVGTAPPVGAGSVTARSVIDRV